MKKILLFFTLINFIVLSGQNINDLWKVNNYHYSSEQEWETNELPSEFLSFRMDIDKLENKLINIPNRSKSNELPGVLISFPNIDKGFETYEVYEAPVLSYELQQSLPSAKSYIGTSLTNKQKIIRFSVSMFGLKAVILNSKKGIQFIDCITKDRKSYAMYYRKDLSDRVLAVNCLGDYSASHNRGEYEFEQRHVNDGQLREFRLALACTEEFSTYYVNTLNLSSSSNIVKKNAILNVMNDIMTRVNAVYENELSITMTIIPANRDIIFLSDSFLTNNDISVLIDESQTFIDAFIQSGNYDIGHMLSTSGSGLAQLYSPCTSNKARAVSGGLGGAPIGVVYENTMLHEMGHQYGAFHTYNSTSCASAATSSSAYEPGGGTTIMSYAGICGTSSNIQSTADNYFHQNSINQMWFNITQGNSTCALSSPTGNNEPIADAGNNYTIPIGTPYKLIGTGFDIDGNESLTYSWEQFDLGSSVAAPSDITLDGPVVRSFPPSTDNTRFIPRLEDYVSNVNSSTDWEKLLLINRDVNFSLAVRDNDISGGQIGVDYMTVTVDNSGGPFTVTSQNVNNLSFSGGSTQTVTWNIANTNLSPFNSNSVNIRLSTNGGLTFDTLLISNTPNDGSESVILPNLDAASCRIMVESASNIFYNINTKNFAIQEDLNVEEVSGFKNLSVFPNPSKGKFTIQFDSKIDYNHDVIVDIYDISGRSVYEKAFSNANAHQFSQTIDLSDMAVGVYVLNISAGTNNSSYKIIIE